MDITILQDFVKEFADKDIDKKFYALRMYKNIKKETCANKSSKKMKIKI